MCCGKWNKINSILTFASATANEHMSVFGEFLAMRTSIYRMFGSEGGDDDDDDGKSASTNDRNILPTHFRKSTEKYVVRARQTAVCPWVLRALAEMDI